MIFLNLAQHATMQVNTHKESIVNKIKVVNCQILWVHFTKPPNSLLFFFLLFDKKYYQKTDNKTQNWSSFAPGFLNQKRKNVITNYH